MGALASAIWHTRLRSSTDLSQRVANIGGTCVRTPVGLAQLKPSPTPDAAIRFAIAPYHLISRNSRSARSASAFSTGQSCRHCSGCRKSRAGRNSARRHHTRSNGGPGQCTKGAGRGVPIAASRLSGRKVEGCCSAAAGHPAGSHSRASAEPAAFEAVRPERD